jgi:hypothetical protein
VQSLPPSVSLPGHHAKVGLLLEWRLSPSGDWHALVEYTDIVPGYTGGLDPQQSWFRTDQVQPIEGVDYSNVPRTHA